MKKHRKKREPRQLRTFGGKRICYNCGHLKPLNKANFYPRNEGFQAFCIDCGPEIQKAWRDRDRERRIQEGWRQVDLRRKA